jgi:alkanesulfonate monooxygenase SsuD/methylene tetrahydromethanopterin reductase-like flavin-dependent oxidoreductase (luciferase family)
MKVRIGISLGPAGEPAGFASAVEPLAGIAFAPARTARLKAGSGVSVLPGRHPVLVAKQLTSPARRRPRCAGPGGWRTAGSGRC